MPEPKYTTETCRSTRAILLRTPTAYIWFCPPCKSWRCKLCQPHKRWGWGHHLAGVLMGQPRQLYVAEVGDAEWDNAHRSITRSRKDQNAGSFIRIGELVISTAPVGFGGNNIISVRAAIRRIGKELKEIDPTACEGKRCRPVNTSQRWALPVTVPSENKVVVKLGFGATKESIRRAMEEAGIVCSPRRSGSGWAMIFDPTTSAEEIGRVIAGIQRAA